MHKDLGNAQLNGTITDPSGGAISGATITVRNPATDVSYTGDINASGYYAIANMQPGTYELKVNFSGFANYTQTGTGPLRWPGSDDQCRDAARSRKAKRSSSRPKSR